jgi:curli biogenesis system outer membrane secretion channel CsgG
MRHLTGVVALVLVAAAMIVSQPATAATNTKPSVAIMNFSSEGLDWWWTAGVDPGAALSELLTDQLVNLDTMTVVDRTHINDIMQEKNLTISGDVSPATAMRLGRLIGAKYIMVGRIVQFQHTSTNSGSVGSFINPVLNGASVRGDKVTLQVASRLIEVSTGRIVESVPEERTKVSTSFSVAAFAPYVGGTYNSQQFLSSGMGVLINEAAKEMAGKIDIAKLQTAGSTGPTINGHVLTIDGSDVVINRGSADGVSEGMFFNVYDTKSVKDPDTGKMTYVKVKKGSIQITSVDTHSAQGKVTDGSAAAGAVVTSE